MPACSGPRCADPTGCTASGLHVTPPATVGGVNAFQDQARAEKAQRLAAAINEAGGTRADAERMSDTEWAGLAAAIGVPAPSGDTVAATLDALDRPQPAPAAPQDPGGRRTWRDALGATPAATAVAPGSAGTVTLVKRVVVAADPVVVAAVVAALGDGWRVE